MTDHRVLEITPTGDELRQLLADLQVLRERGALTNTKAILESVRLAVYSGQDTKRPGSAGTPPARHQEVES